jgi:hypothetical protein
MLAAVEMTMQSHVQIAIAIATCRTDKLPALSLQSASRVSVLKSIEWILFSLVALFPNQTRKRFDGWWICIFGKLLRLGDVHEAKGTRLSECLSYEVLIWEFDRCDWRCKLKWSRGVLSQFIFEKKLDFGVKYNLMNRFLQNKTRDGSKPTRASSFGGQIHTYVDGLQEALLQGHHPGVQNPGPSGDPYVEYIARSAAHSFLFGNLPNGPAVPSDVHIS